MWACPHPRTEARTAPPPSGRTLLAPAAATGARTMTRRSMESTVGTEPVRPARIVMLVDNGVNGDSRVQKTARSAADAGWDVTLIGRSPNGTPQTWKLGGATVQ